MSLYVFTGPPGAGKNTIAEALSHLRARIAVIDVDQVRWMVRQPHKAPWEGSDGKEQQVLGVENACMLAEKFLKAEYDVAILDVLSDSTVALYRSMLGQYDPRIILLLPSYEEVLRRNALRPPRLSAEEIKMLYEEQVALQSFDRKIDNSMLDPKQVIEQLSV
jgi:dephospho-CoA kinase